MILSIGYDLNRPGQDYTRLIEAIKSIGPWAKPLASQWLVVTNQTASQLSERLRPLIDSSDSLFINRLDASDCSGWLSQDVWNWITKNKQ